MAENTNCEQQMMMNTYLTSASESKKWTPESGIPGLLLVRTVEPSSTWIFAPTRDVLRISSTAPGAVLTGHAPVSKARQLARLLDSNGTPVTWRGTGECAGTYGGGFTNNPSFLPRENPECLYFTLGQASGSVLHSMFDQNTNTAIRFTPQTRFSAGTEEQLEFTMPLPGPGLSRLIPDYYTKVLGLPHYAPLDTSIFDRAPTTWCSWASYFGDVTEDAIVKNTDWIADYIHHYPEILDLKVAEQSGTYDVVALPNWRSATVKKEVSLVRQLGLDPGEKYVAFDFWNQARLIANNQKQNIRR